MTDQIFELEIYATIRQPGTSGCLEIREKVEVDESGFLEIAGILSKFQELAQALKKHEP